MSEMNIELIVLAILERTRMKASIARPVESVQSARLLRRPSLVWIIHAPICAGSVSAHGRGVRYTHH